MLAQHDIAERMCRVTDVIENISVHVAERMSVCALDHLEEVSAKSKE